MPGAGKWLCPSSLCFFKQMVNQYQKDGRHGGIGLYQNKGSRNYGSRPLRLLISEKRRSQSETQRYRIGGQAKYRQQHYKQPQPSRVDDSLRGLEQRRRCGKNARRGRRGQDRCQGNDAQT